METIKEPIKISDSEWEVMRRDLDYGPIDCQRNH